MIFLRAKGMFKREEYDRLIELAKSSNVNLALTRLFIHSIIVYTGDILYTKEEKAKARELEKTLEKVEYVYSDEVGE